MTTFDDRENAYEAKFAHDEAMDFKVQARANKKLAIWAAELMGVSGEAREEYIRAVIASDFEEAGDEDVIRKVAADLGDLSDPEQIRAKRAEFVAQTKAEMVAES